MRYFKLNYGVLPTFVLAVFLVSAPARAQTQADVEDARKLLEEATADQIIPGSYKRISVTEKSGIVATECEYRLVRTDGVSLSRTETERRSDYSIYYSTSISNQDGEYFLYADNIAIKAPPTGHGLDLPDEATMAKRREAMYRSMALEHVTDKSVRYIKITSVLSDDDIKELRAFTKKTMKEVNAGVFGLPLRLVDKLTGDKIPGRVEFWLDETDRHLVRTRYLTKKGRLIYEQKSSGVYERVSDLTEDMFVVPVEYEIIRTENFMEFIRMSYKYPAKRVKLDPKKESAEASAP